MGGRKDEEGVERGAAVIEPHPSRHTNFNNKEKKKKKKKKGKCCCCVLSAHTKETTETYTAAVIPPRNPTGLKMCDTIPNKLKISSLTLEMSLNRIITKYYTVVKEELNLDCCIRVDARRLSKHATAIKYPPVKVEKHQPTLCNNNNRKNEKKRFFF